MAAPDPREIFPVSVWARLVALGTIGDADGVSQQIDQRETRQTLLLLLAVGLGLTPDELTIERVGDSWGLSVSQRANKTAKIIKENAVTQARRIKNDANRIRRRPNGGRFAVAGFSSGKRFREKYQVLVKAGQGKLAANLLEKEIARLSAKAAARNIEKRSAYYAWRFTDTEYRRVKNRRRQERIVASPKYDREIVIPQAGYCNICAAYVFKPAPAGTTRPPPYHPNCRCKIYPWEALTGHVTDF